MGRVTVTRISLHQLDAAKNPFQSEFWAKAKRYSQWGALALRVRVVGPDTGVSEPIIDESTLLVLVRKLYLSFHFAYIPFGPKINHVPMPEGQFLRDLAKAIRPILPRGTICLRYDLPWNEIPATEVAPINARGLHRCKESVQPEGTSIISLEGGYEHVRSGYRERAIRNIRKSVVSGIVVREWEQDEEVFKQWYDVYLQTAKRDGFNAREENYLKQFLKLANSLPEKIKRSGRNRMKVEQTGVSSESEVTCNLYVAYLGKQLIGGTMIMESKFVAVYLFGSSLRVDGISCSYLLQDYAIAKACEHGRLAYDLYGISGPGNRGSHLDGLRLFKRAFGGAVYYRHPSIDFVFHLLPWAMYSRIEYLRYRAMRMRQPKRISQQFSVSHEV